MLISLNHIWVTFGFRRFKDKKQEHLINYILGGAMTGVMACGLSALLLATTIKGFFMDRLIVAGAVGVCRTFISRRFVNSCALLRAIFSSKMVDAAAIRMRFTLLHIKSLVSLLLLLCFLPSSNAAELNSMVADGWRISSEHLTPLRQQPQLHSVLAAAKPSGGLTRSAELDQSGDNESSPSSLSEARIDELKTIATSLTIEPQLDVSRWRAVAWKNMRETQAFPISFERNVETETVILLKDETVSVEVGDQLDILVEQSSGKLAYLLISVDPAKAATTPTTKVLNRAAVRSKSRLGGSLDQRIVAIYIANKSALDQDTQYRDQLLILPELKSLRAYEPVDLARMAAELKLEGFTQLNTLTHSEHVSSSVCNFGSSAAREEAPKSVGIPSEFKFETGYLKDNLSRFLHDCGWTIGQWRFGDDEHEYDFEIDKGYFSGAGTLDELLALVERTYLLSGTKNSLDKTVDFQPARGGTLEDMELRKW